MTPRVSRTGPRIAVRAVRALVAVLLATCWAALPGAGPAHAEDPVDLAGSGLITDRAHALGDRAPEVAAALDRLHEDRLVQLFAVYVDDFSGRTAQDWADTTAQKNGLGRDDVLLAVATGSRQYAYSVDQGFRLSDQTLGEVARESVEPALRRGDWPGAAIGAAEGLDTALAEPARRDGSTSASDFVLPVAVLVVAGAVAAYAYARRKRRTATRTTPASAQGAGAQGGERAAGPPQDSAPDDLAALEAEADRTLVATDEAIRTSDEELGFALAQFGEEAARPFARALAYARSELATAFRLRQQLDDDPPPEGLALPEGPAPPDEPELPEEGGAARRRMLREIVSRCAAAGRRLDAESEAFDALRALEHDPQRALEAVETAFRTLTGRTAAADSTLTALRQRYAESATAPVAGHVEEAKERLVAATAALNAARQALDTDDRGEAAAQVRAAEGAVAHAAALVDAVDRRGRELADAEELLPAALAGAESALTEARGLELGVEPPADLREPVAGAETVLVGVGRARAAGPYDPLDALRRVGEAEADLEEALDEALAGVREREGGADRSRALLDRAALTARSAVAAADDCVTTHRDAVGSAARTRLAEARRHLAQAEAEETAGPDAPDALAEVRRADTLAQQARGLAEADVQAYEQGDEQADVQADEGGPETFGKFGKTGNANGPGGVSEAGTGGVPGTGAGAGSGPAQGEEP
ncbi:TPM domain-containing protein [Streptomyces sp. BPTC-684]|uniref:TPM domain-containing protein n=1 Tax=Streptomyces sp. BPTC-684 TaxID=3043734 RepID=UPI0024B153CF|nr:TPM domain-containing protein [Streptomyces sp. BPTC-684]WHM36821.1 TPM domain-containing protein [Streptomyces sp. BPTC-684]